MERELKLAQVNHCLTFEQVADELIEYFHIKTGNFDSVGNCKYTVPGYLEIGKGYQRLITSVKKGKLANKIMNDRTSGMGGFQKADKNAVLQGSDEAAAIRKYRQQQKGEGVDLLAQRESGLRKSKSGNAGAAKEGKRELNKANAALKERTNASIAAKKQLEAEEAAKWTNRAKKGVKDAGKYVSDKASKGGQWVKANP